MGTVGPKSLDFSSSIHQEDFATVDAFNLYLLLGTWRKRERGEVSEFVFLGH